MDKDTVEAIAAALTPVVALLAAYIAFQQYRVERLKVRHDLFDRRLAVYHALSELLSVITQEGYADRDALLTFLRKTRESYFLFGEEISDYLDEIHGKAVDLQTYESRLRGLPVGDERTKTAEAQGELTKWFLRQWDVARAKFGKYLILG